MRVVWEEVKEERGKGRSEKRQRTRYKKLKRRRKAGEENKKQKADTVLKKHRVKRYHKNRFGCSNVLFS